MIMTERNEIFKFTQKEKRIFSILSVFMMFGNVYIFPLIPVLGWGEVLFLVFMPYFVIKARSIFVISQTEFMLVVFMIYGLLITLFAGAYFQTSLVSIITRLARDFFYYFIIVFLGTKLLDKTIFFELVNLFCVCLSIFVIVQSAVYIFTGFFIPGFLLDFQINDGQHMGREVYSNYLSYARIAGYLRPNGFLCEPAHCAQCFFVDLILILFGVEEKNRKTYICAAIVSLGSFITMSTSAVVYLATVFVMWIVKEGKHDVLKIVAIIVLTFMLFFVAYSRGNLDNMLSVVRRLSNALEGDPVTNSTALRIQKGIAIFINLPIIFKLFGIGFGTYSSALSNSVISATVTGVDNEYMNSFSYILVSSGVIGSIIMVGTFLVLYRKSTQLGRMMIIALFIMSLGSSIYSSPISVWLMLVILNSRLSYKIDN